MIILISRRVIFEHIATIKDKEGRFILVQGKVDGEMVTFYNVYIPPGATSEFYTQILDRVVTETKDVLVCGGDFNTTLKPHLDSSGKRASQSQKLTRKINLMIAETGLVDIWRHLNPTKRDYTFYSSPHTSYSRIDYFFSFCNDINTIQECHNGTRDISDHCPLYLSQY